MNLRSPKFLAILTVVVLAVPMFLAPAAAAPTAQAKMGDVRTASDAFASKIHPNLETAVAAAAATDSINVLVYAKAGTDLSRYLSKMLVRKYIMPDGTQAYFGAAKAGQVTKLASLREVAAIQEMKSPFDVPPASPDADVKTRLPDGAALSARLAMLKTRGAKATVVRPAANPAKIADWFTVTDPMKSRAAWGLGFTGAGVKVLVNDSGMDFAHPDLQGTQARDTNPESPYFGWPMGFDSYSMLNLAYDYFLGYDFIKSGVGYGSIPPNYADTSTTRSGGDLVDNGDGTYSAVFAPIGSTVPGGHVYTFKPTSKSGVYHFGSHVDTALMTTNPPVFDERWAVLVVDENEAGVYDTVYVDLDDDYSFLNEKPARKGDEISYQDLDGDGYADLSGGMIYWISDGANSLPSSDWMWGIGPDVAGPGDLVAFSILNLLDTDHGQLCASAVAGQGVIDGGAPAWKPAGDGTPGTGMLVGAGKDAKLVASGDYYLTYESLEPYIFAALGYDGLPGTEDDVQIVSDSHGDSATDNDGWDYYSRSMDAILRYVNPTVSEVKAAGNGGAGYGTLTTATPSLGINVGASTQFDSLSQFERPATLDQMNYNDAMSWSGRGPSAIGNNGVNVMANGAFGAGALGLNETLDGWNAWGAFGGTSEATPTTSGNLALVYQAFKSKNGRWPTNVEAKALLMAGADNAYNDGFVQGAGTVNALRSVKLAAGLDGIYTTPTDWTAGGYRGKEYDAFAKIMLPGQSDSQTFTITNPGTAGKTVAISSESLAKTGSRQWEFTSQDRTQESAYNQAKPDYLWDVTNMVPAGTDLLEVKAAYPFSEFDANGDTKYDQSWRLLVYDWTDINGDGKFWQDLNGNGAVNCLLKSGRPDYADANCEIQAGEINRYSYGYDFGTSLQVRVKLPQERRHDGLFVGLLHRDRSALEPVTHMKFQMNFYKFTTFPWLTTDASVTVPAGGSATFNATMAVPALANVGAYESFIRLNDGTNVSSIPVVVNVAAFSTEFLFGGPPESSAPYDNGQVYGYFDWNWRSESGDWRFYFVDVPDSTPAGTSFLVDSRWTGAGSDLDTVVMGPTADCFSNGDACDYPFSIFPGHEAVYGPYTLATTGGSTRSYIGSGKWRWGTSTGGPREIVAAPATPGLNQIAVQNVLFNGTETAERFQGQVGTINAAPSEVDIFVGVGTSGSFPVTIESSLPLVGLLVDAFGLGVPETTTGLPQIQDNPDDPSTSSYKFPITVQHGARLDVSTEGAAGDLDLYVLYDYNADGVFDFDNEVIGSSTTSSANEFVSVTMPKNGNYLAAVHGWSAAGTFDYTVNNIQGTDMTISDLPAGPFQPDTPINFTVNWTKTIPAGEAAEGLILVGPPGAPAALQIPVRLSNSIAGSATATLVAMDATVSHGQPNDAFGKSPYLYVGENDGLRSALQFDLSGIYPNPVQSAKLRVYVDAYASTGLKHDLKYYTITTPWAEDTVTWKLPWTAPGGDFAATAVAGTSISSADVGKWIEVDVTELVSKWNDGSLANNGVLMRAINGIAYAKFRLASGEFWDTEKRPQLVVTYGVP